LRLSDFKFQIDFPKRANVVYVLFYGDEEKPFYVGETASIIARMADYLRGTFAAATDFKVGESVRYFAQRGVRVRVGYEEYPDRLSARKREDELIVHYREKGFSLLNDLVGYNYRTANAAEEKDKVQKFCDGLLPRRPTLI
jgi:predicted GIY-YIG superfamily endonuclease